MDRSVNKHIVLLGESTFPAGLAAVQRMTLIAKALLSSGYKVTVICRKGGSIDASRVNFPPEGNFEGIKYIYTSGEILRPSKLVRRNFMKIKGMWREFLFLKRLKRENNLCAAIISNHSTFHLIRYRLYSWVIGFPIVLNFVEMASVMKSRERLWKKVNDHFFDKYVVKIVDGALPISEKLLDYYRSLSPGKPNMKLPILCDFEKFHYTPRADSDIIFLYCGAASYLELVDFVIRSFDHLNFQQDNVHLKLVLGGKENELNKIRERIAIADRKDRIQLVTNVPHGDIPQLYSQASALLIPLRPTLQDEARFPHKIGEYLASGRPMVTTAFGEINHYDFIDGETALIADDYEAGSFAEKMRFVLTNPEKSISIGIKGRQMGLENFEYSKQGIRLLKYFSDLKKGSK